MEKEYIPKWIDEVQDDPESSSGIGSRLERATHSYQQERHVTVRRRSLSFDIDDEYPWDNVYRRRKRRYLDTAMPVLTGTRSQNENGGDR